MNTSLKLKTILAVTAALVLICSGGAWAQQPLSDSEYKRLMKSSPEYAAADREMARVWKSLPGEVKKMELPHQRDWIKNGRDREAASFIRRGAGRAEAYTRATRLRTHALRDLAAYPPKYSSATTLPGHIKPGGQYTFDQADRELNRFWNSMSPGLKDQIRPEQRQWVEHGRERAARVYQRQGYNRDQALALATRDRLETLRNYVRGRY